jgi:hypothetical protein
MSLFSRILRSNRGYQPVDNDDRYDHDPEGLDDTRMEMVGSPSKARRSLPFVGSSSSSPRSATHTRLPICSILSRGKGKGRRGTRIILIVALVLFFLPIAIFVASFFLPSLYHKIDHYTKGLKCRAEIKKFDELNPPSPPSNVGLVRNPKLGHYDQDDKNDDESTWSTIMSASELMSRLTDPSKFPDSGGRVPPRILHQSWKNHKLPERFAKWSKSWRKTHGTDWV